MVVEMYNLSKNSSLSKYTVVYSKLCKIWQTLIFFVENVFIRSTFPLSDHRRKYDFIVKFTH